jgi:hypothetical protein
MRGGNRQTRSAGTGQGFIGFFVKSVDVFRWLVFSKVVIQSNSAGRRRSDPSLNKNVEVLIRQNLILVSRQNLSVCEVACYYFF